MRRSRGIRGAGPRWACSRWLLSLLVAAGVVSAVQTASASAAVLDLTGIWTVVNTSGPGAPGTLDITNGRGGAFDGTGYGGGFVVRGTVSGSHVHYTVSDSSYTSTVEGTLNGSGTRITYTWSDTNKASGTAYLERTGAGTPPGTGQPEPIQGPQLCKAGASAASTSADALMRIGGPLESLDGFHARALTASAQTVTVGKKLGRKGRVLTLHQAERRAMALLHLPRRPLPDGVAIYGLAKPLRAGSVVSEDQLGLPEPILPALRIRTSAWLYWEDLAPLARLTHRGVVLVFAARGGKLLARANFLSYPKINGRAAGFVTSARRHTVYYQAPAPAHPVHLSAQQLAQIKRAVALTKATSRTTLAHTSETNKNVLITISAIPKMRDETFKSEEAAITKVFAEHGVATAESQSVNDFKAKVGTAADAGATTITLYLTGHGTDAVHSSQPLVALGEGQYLTAKDLTELAAAHPDVTFNVIVDACFSGRFVDPLKALPNVATVSTSSSAGEYSKGPETLYDRAEVVWYSKYGDLKGDGPVSTDPNAPPHPETVSLPDPVAVTPSGHNLYLDIPENLPLSPETVGNVYSPFTTGMVSALKQAFIGTGPEPNITSVIRDARTLEPTYDIAAIAGQTHPSPEPTPTPACIAPNAPEPEPTGGWFTGE
jgi:hypothetical protein